MPETIALSSHGTFLARETSPGVFEDIAEVGDLSLPGLTRNEFDATTHNRDIDAYIMGVLRREAFSFPLNFLPADPTHDHLTGLYAAIIANEINGYRITFPTAAGGIEWILSGQVKQIVPKAPVDGKLSADVTLRFSGLMSIGGVVVGVEDVTP